MTRQVESAVQKHLVSGMVGHEASNHHRDTEARRNTGECTDSLQLARWEGIGWIVLRFFERDRSRFSLRPYPAWYRNERERILGRLSRPPSGEEALARTTRKGKEELWRTGLREKSS